MHASFVVSVKAFGDFVIACNCLRRIEELPSDRSRPKLLAGDHLRALAGALGLESEVHFITTRGKYPAAYDVHGSGIWQALGSLVAMRSQFRRLPPECELIFDRVGWRERFLAARLERRCLFPAENIYISIAQTLRSVGYGLRSLDNSRASPRDLRPQGNAVIFPASRVAKKRIPAAVVGRVMDQLAEAGLRGEVVRLAGETLDLPPHVSARSIDHNFDALITTIRASDLVVSADSLPAHLAEYFGIPTYVIFPAPNEYWLPLSAFQDRSWNVFDDQHSLTSWLSRRVVAHDGERACKV